MVIVPSHFLVWQNSFASMHATACYSSLAFLGMVKRFERIPARRQGYSSLAFLGMVKPRLFHQGYVSRYSSLAFLGMVKLLRFSAWSSPCYSSLAFLGMVKRRRDERRHRIRYSSLAFLGMVKPAGKTEVGSHSYSSLAFLGMVKPQCGKISLKSTVSGIFFCVNQVSAAARSQDGCGFFRKPKASRSQTVRPPASARRGGCLSPRTAFPSPSACGWLRFSASVP